MATGSTYERIEIEGLLDDSEDQKDGNEYRERNDNGPSFAASIWIHKSFQPNYGNIKSYYIQISMPYQKYRGPVMY